MLKMLSLRSFWWAGTIQKLEGIRTKDVSGIHRHFSSAASTGRIRSKSHEPPSIIHLQTWRKVPQAVKPFSCLQPRRFASTDLHPPTLVNSSPSSVAQPVGAPVEQAVPSPLDSITSAEYPRIEESIGYLRDLGLDYGWGPTSLLQNVLEYVHMYTGTGWGVSAVLTALLIRLVLLKAFINASDAQARVAVVSPNIAPLKARLKEARLSKDRSEMAAIAAELKQVYSAAGIKNWKLFVPMLQLPLGFGSFRLLRGMADLPVPGLDSAGFLWVTDLTAPDPYYLLPIVTGFAFHLTFKKGGELGTAQMNEAMQVTLTYGAPLATSIFMMWWPGVLQMTFAFTSMMSLLQSYLLRQPWMRDFLQIQPLPEKNIRTPSNYTGTMTRYQSPLSTPPDPPVKPGVIGGAISEIKGAASQVMTSARRIRNFDNSNKKGSRRRSPAELKRAQEYEQRRRREIAEEKMGGKRGKR